MLLVYVLLFYTLGVHSYPTKESKSSSKHNEANCIVVTDEKQRQIDDIVNRISVFINKISVEYDDIDLRLIEVELDKHSSNEGEKDTMIQVTINDCSDKAIVSDQGSSIEYLDASKNKTEFEETYAIEEDDSKAKSDKDEEDKIESSVSDDSLEEGSGYNSLESNNDDKEKDLSETKKDKDDDEEVFQNYSFESVNNNMRIGIMNEDDEIGDSEDAIGVNEDDETGKNQDIETGDDNNDTELTNNNNENDSVSEEDEDDKLSSDDLQLVSNKATDDLENNTTSILNYTQDTNIDDSEINQSTTDLEVSNSSDDPECAPKNSLVDKVYEIMVLSQEDIDFLEEMENVRGDRQFILYQKFANNTNQLWFFFV